MSPIILAASLAIWFADEPDPKPLSSLQASHDQVRDVSKLCLDLGRVYTDPEPHKAKIDARIYAEWNGLNRKALTQSDKVRIQVDVTAGEWFYIQERFPSHDLAMLAGNNRLKATNGNPERRTKDKIETYVIAKNNLPYTESRRIFLCVESTTWDVPFGDLQRIATSGESYADMAVGTLNWKINSRQMSALRSMVEQLLVSSEEAIARERDVAQRQAEAMQAERARLEPFRAEVDAAIEKARRAGKAVPKKLYATAGEKIKWRTLDRELEPIIKKYKLQPKDIDALLLDHPDFRVRSKIE
ncbi:hypothetical protein [Paludisphaera rhizosphaerae]|uniref:hypothetical protein n=1 Tax=Paludisphaera rhizosphaerae TaxID=2711216 RepID=UPI0013EC1B5B|nr:hypothetical protein [Paludisphaera rhizosphaerae]